MPLNAIGWSTEEDEKLVELVQQHPNLYNALDTSRKNIVAREDTWHVIARDLQKSVLECKKRWRCLRDSYTRNKRVGGQKTRSGIFAKLQFLDETSLLGEEPEEESMTDSLEVGPTMIGTEQVITDNQEYYEITVVDDSTHQEPEEMEVKPTAHLIKLLPKPPDNNEPPKKIIKRSNCGRKKSVPLPRNLTPVKILPKPILMNRPKIVGFVEEPKTPEQRTQVIDKLIEKVLKENTNEIDVFFRSMAQSVKKLQPNLIPKVKMEVCNVIAKYEMQSFERSNQ